MRDISTQEKFSVQIIFQHNTFTETKHGKILPKQFHLHNIFLTKTKFRRIFFPHDIFTWQDLLVCNIFYSQYFYPNKILLTTFLPDRISIHTTFPPDKIFHSSRQNLEKYFPSNIFSRQDKVWEDFQLSRQSLEEYFLRATFSHIKKKSRNICVRQVYLVKIFSTYNIYTHRDKV